MDKELQKLTDELNERYERWHHLKDYGGSDPFHEDGFNMWLVRNHIHNIKRRIKDYCDEKDLEYPKEYYRKNPPEVDQKYMANKKQIKKQAIISLGLYEKDTNFKKLEEIYGQINNKDKRSIAANILGYKRWLKKAIENNDYLVMRRHGNPKSYLNSLKRFLDSLEDEDLLGQVSML